MEKNNRAFLQIKEVFDLMIFDSCKSYGKCKEGSVKLRPSQFKKRIVKKKVENQERKWLNKG